MRATIADRARGGAAVQPTGASRGLPPEIDADFAARMTSEELLHMECQGYRDSGFSERVLW